MTLLFSECWLYWCHSKDCCWWGRAVYQRSVCSIRLFLCAAEDKHQKKRGRGEGEEALQRNDQSLTATLGKQSWFMSRLVAGSVNKCLAQPWITLKDSTSTRSSILSFFCVLSLEMFSNDQLFWTKFMSACKKPKKDYLCQIEKPFSCWKVSSSGRKWQNCSHGVITRHFQMSCPDPINIEGKEPLQFICWPCSCLFTRHAVSGLLGRRCVGGSSSTAKTSTLQLSKIPIFGSFPLLLYRLPWFF